MGRRIGDKTIKTIIISILVFALSRRQAPLSTRCLRNFEVFPNKPPPWPIPYDRPTVNMAGVLFCPAETINSEFRGLAAALRHVLAKESTTFSLWRMLFARKKKYTLHAAAFCKCFTTCPFRLGRFPSFPIEIFVRRLEYCSEFVFILQIIYLT